MSIDSLDMVSEEHLYIAGGSVFQCGQHGTQDGDFSSDRNRSTI